MQPSLNSHTHCEILPVTNAHTLLSHQSAFAEGTFSPQQKWDTTCVSVFMHFSHQSYKSLPHHRLAKVSLIASQAGEHLGRVNRETFR